MSQVIYLYSTLATDQKYSTEMGDILVAGKANVSSKHLLTPRGVVTKITEEQFEFLKENKVFEAHCRNQFITGTLSKLDPEDVAEDLNDKDKSAQDTPTRIRKRGRSNAAPAAKQED